MEAQGVPDPGCFLTAAENVRKGRGEVGKPHWGGGRGGLCAQPSLLGFIPEASVELLRHSM